MPPHSTSEITADERVAASVLGAVVEEALVNTAAHVSLRLTAPPRPLTHPPKQILRPKDTTYISDVSYSADWYAYSPTY